MCAYAIMDDYGAGTHFKVSMDYGNFQAQESSG
jgi:hypothetical protein